MKKEELLQQISDGFTSTNPQDVVSRICRDFLKDRIIKSEIKDLYIKDALLSFVESFVAKLDCEQVSNSPVSISQKIKEKAYCYYGLAGLAGITSLISDNLFVRFLSCSTLAFASIFATKYMLGTATFSVPKLSFVVKTSADDVYIQVRQFEEIISKFIGFNSLDTYDKGLLSWMQQQYSESDDENFKKSLKLVLKQCGYEFLDYSEEIKDYFDSFSANVSKITTTYPAIRSNHSGFISQRGVVVFPMN